MIGTAGGSPVGDGCGLLRGPVPFNRVRFRPYSRAWGGAATGVGMRCRDCYSTGQAGWSRPTRQPIADHMAAGPTRFNGTKSNLTSSMAHRRGCVAQDTGPAVAWVACAETDVFARGRRAGPRVDLPTAIMIISSRSSSLRFFHRLWCTSRMTSVISLRPLGHQVPVLLDHLRRAARRPAGLRPRLPPRRPPRRRVRPPGRRRPHPGPRPLALRRDRPPQRRRTPPRRRGGTRRVTLPRSLEFFLSHPHPHLPAGRRRGTDVGHGTDVWDRNVRFCTWAQRSPAGSGRGAAPWAARRPEAGRQRQPDSRG